jgi:hypothetical protein
MKSNLIADSHTDLHRETKPKQVGNFGLNYRTPNEFACTLKKASYGKDAGYACLENAAGVSHFATAPTTR